MRPAQIKLGNSIQKIDMHCEFCNNQKAILYLDSADQLEARTYTNFLISLKSTLEKSPIFKNAEISLITSDSLLATIKDVKSRTKEDGLILLLDSVYLQDSVFTGVSRNWVRYYTFGIIHKFGCHTYNKANMQVIDNHILEDTLFWPPYPNLYELWYNNLPVPDALIETGAFAGEAYAHYLAPYWVDESRIFYFGYNKIFKKAYNLLQNNELDSALNVLLKPEKEFGKNLSMMRFHNIAIIYELKDDMQNAYLNADSAYSIKKTEITKKYIERLRVRRLDKSALDWQLN